MSENVLRWCSNLFINIVGMFLRRKSERFYYTGSKKQITYVSQMFLTKNSISVLSVCCCVGNFMKFKKYLRNIFQTGFDKILKNIQAEGRKFGSSKYTCWLLVKTKYNTVK